MASPHLLCVKTTLFLGAGASVFAGMPTTKALVQNVLHRVIHQEKWESPAATSLARNLVRDNEDKDIEMLYKTIRDMKAAEELHREAMGHKIAGDNHPGWRREILTTRGSNPENSYKKDEADDIDETTKTLEALETAIRNTLLTNLMVKPDKVDDVVATYDELFRHVSRNILTTNYDNVLETYCEETETDLVNGFSQSHLGDRRMWDGSLEGGGGALQLVKLHGSITWQKDDDGTILEIGRPGIRDTDRDVMIMPTLGDKDYSDDIFPLLLAELKKILAETGLLIVVGFSFRDPRINHMLRSRLTRSRGNPNPMMLLCVDPNPDVLRELVDPDDKRLPKSLSEMYGLLVYSLDTMPYVFGYRGEFDLNTVRSLEHLLTTMTNMYIRMVPKQKP